MTNAMDVLGLRRGRGNSWTQDLLRQNGSTSTAAAIKPPTAARPKGILAGMTGQARPELAGSMPGQESSLFGGSKLLSGVRPPAPETSLTPLAKRTPAIAAPAQPTAPAAPLSDAETLLGGPLSRRTSTPDPASAAPLSAAAQDELDYQQTYGDGTNPDDFRVDLKAKYSGMPYIVDTSGQFVPDPDYEMVNGVPVKKAPAPPDMTLPDFTEDPAADIAERSTAAQLLGLEKNLRAGVTRDAAVMGLQPGDPAYQAMQERAVEPMLSQGSGVLAGLARDRVAGAATRERNYQEDIYRMLGLEGVFSADQVGMLKNKAGASLGLDLGGADEDPNASVQILQSYYEYGKAMGKTDQDAWAYAQERMKSNDPNILPDTEGTGTTAPPALTGTTGGAPPASVGAMENVTAYLDSIWSSVPAKINQDQLIADIQNYAQGTGVDSHNVFYRIGNLPGAENAGIRQMSTSNPGRMPGGGLSFSKPTQEGYDYYGYHRLMERGLTEDQAWSAMVAAVGPERMAKAYLTLNNKPRTQGG